MVVVFHVQVAHEGLDSQILDRGVLNDHHRFVAIAILLLHLALFSLILGKLFDRLLINLFQFIFDLSLYVQEIKPQSVPSAK